MNKSIVSFILSGTLIVGSLQDISALNTCTDSIVSVGKSNHIIKKINRNELSKSHSSILRNTFITSSILGGTLGIGTIATIATILALEAYTSNGVPTEQINSVVQNINTNELSTIRKNVVEEKNSKSTEQSNDVLGNTDTSELSYEYTYESDVEEEDSKFTEQSDDNDGLLDSHISRLDSVGRILERENSLLRIRVNQGQKVYMVGDIHSDLKALDFVLEFMSSHPNDKFVFLGDYVDRGNCGEEVFLKLAELKISNPNRVFLLRGNHETKEINSIYGFLDELKGKYDDYDDYDEIYDKFNDVFDKLPVAAVLDCGITQIFCVHGGICPSERYNGVLKLDELENLQKVEPTRNSILENVLWSDPENRGVEFAESYRGAGYKFGPSAVGKFLGENNLDYIIRAHETVQNGIREEFDGKVKTVFSAPHYCGRMDNKGAILGFDNTSNNFEVIRFDRSHQPGSPYVRIN